MARRAARLAGAKELAIDLSPVVFGQRGHEFDPARILVERNSRLNETLNVFGKHFAWFVPLTRHDERLWLHQSVASVVANDRALQYGFMLQQTVFNFRRRDKNTTDLQHVVGAAVVPVIAVAVDVHLVSSSAPIARESFFGFLVRVPIAKRR